MPGPIQSVNPVPMPDLRGSSGRTGGSGFQEVMASAIGEVENRGHAATQSIERLLSGEGEDLHTTALAAQRAEIAFDLLLQTRNKVVQAYQEIMRMPM